MKIKLKLHPNHLGPIEELLRSVAIPTGLGLEKKSKMRHSILQQLYKKVLNKAVGVRFSMVEGGKLVSLSLEYFEAYELEDHLRRDVEMFPKGSYEYNAIYLIADELDQQMQ